MLTLGQEPKRTNASSIRLQEKNKDYYIKSYERKIEAIAELVYPYCVWLR